MDVIVGTAGHIDHGKTSLVKALTGIDADRLPEEKQRGITVDLGFAEMSVGEVHFGFVDVPGHERFVKNMLAGASGIDILLLIIAADEGVMPQTREHFDICRLLGVRTGVIVLTKTDRVDSETLELARLEAQELVAGSFLENSPLVCFSARSNDGIEELKRSLVEAAAKLPRRNDDLIVRLPIDRSFSVKGFGTVVTGTLGSGTLSEGDEIELMPKLERVRVRGIQTHGESVKTASAGRRVAVNLGGIDQANIERGMLLSETGVLKPTQVLDAEVEVVSTAARSLRTRQRVRVHIGTVEALARVQVLSDPGEIAAGHKGFVQVRLETPVSAIPGERFIIRRYSPPITIGGGVIIDNTPGRHRRREIAAACERLAEFRNVERPSEMVLLLVSAAGKKGLSLAELRERTGFTSRITLKALEDHIAAGAILNANGRYLETTMLRSLAAEADTAVKNFHRAEPLAKGISREALREQVFAYLPEEIFQAVITDLVDGGKIVLDRESIRSRAYKPELSPAEEELKTRILAIYRDSGLEVPKFPDVLNDIITGSTFAFNEARKLFQIFLDSGEIVKVSEEFYYHKPVIDDLTMKLKSFAATAADRSIDMAKFKDLAGVSRKYAIPLIEYFDRQRVTVRRGDNRYIV